MKEVKSLILKTHFLLKYRIKKQDPYFLDFLGLKDGYLENDLEAAIIKELENFILELGVGFTFV